MSCSSGRCFALYFTLWIFLGYQVLAQPSSVSDFNFPVTDGPVFVALETNGILYVGGGFTQIGPHTGAFAPVSSDRGTLADPAAYLGGTVACSLPDGQGGVYVGGTFVTVGAVLTTNLAHLRADKTLDPSFIFTANASVEALTIYSNRLFVGGSFSVLNGQSRSNLAAVDLDSRQVVTF